MLVVTLGQTKFYIWQQLRVRDGKKSHHVDAFEVVQLALNLFASLAILHTHEHTMNRQMSLAPALLCSPLSHTQSTTANLILAHQVRTPNKLCLSLSLSLQAKLCYNGHHCLQSTPFANGTWIQLLACLLACDREKGEMEMVALMKMWHKKCEQKVLHYF